MTAGSIASSLSRVGRSHGVLGFIAFLILFVQFAPPFLSYRSWAQIPEAFSLQVEVRRGMNVALQVEKPGILIEDPVHKIIRWRLLFPVIGYFTKLPTPLVLGMAHIGCLVACLYLARIFGRRFPEIDPLLLVSAILVLGASAWFFTSNTWLGYYDSWLAVAILAVCFSRSPFLISAATFLAPWIDERFVLVFPLCLLVRWIESGTPLRMDSLMGWIRKEAVLPGVLLLANIIARLVLQSLPGTTTVGGYFSEVSFLKIPVWRHFQGLWEGLRLGWGAVIFGLACFHLRGRTGVSLLLGAASVAMVAIGLATANDLSRSMILLLPVAALGMTQILESDCRPLGRAGLAMLAAGAILLPANHIVSDFTVPIRGLWEELRCLEQPPPAFSPQTHLLKARLALASGDHAGALQSALIAARLDPSRADAQIELAKIYEKFNQFPEAVAAVRKARRLSGDFSLVFEEARLLIEADRSGEAARLLEDAMSRESVTETDREAARRLLERLRKK